ncbi:hypothetical protein [Streptomyces sp. NPDC127098]|uniref:hypothetical protein n=1 Tax=Streptomyces sp. NPDC127098 TaxID=3347137 RepID=UPI00365A6880
MRKSIRLALPAVAATLALALTACGEDEESNSNGGSDNGASETTGGGEGEEAADDAAGDNDGNGQGPAPTAEQIMGSWYVDLNATETSHNLDIFDGSSVTFFEDAGAEGDMCDGTYADGTITLTDCTVLGSEEWTDMSATVAWPGDGTISVTWASGLTETYSNMLADMGDLGDLGDLGDMDLSELEDLEAELEEMGY